MPDYMFLLESRLSAEQRAVLTRMQELGAATQTNVYLSGGAVRDLVSGMPIRDLDFTVEGSPTRFVRELEKGGARTLTENEKLRHAEMVFAGDVDGSIAAARDDVYVRPGTVPEIRWSTIMEDLRRRDFSINAIAISLNPNSRGLLLDPTNGLADLETQHEVRALSIHSFTNQPVRLLRALRYAARMGFKLENRTQEWFDLAIERGLQDSISPDDAGSELRQVAKEEKAGAALKSWESRGLLETISAQLAKRHPDYDALASIARAREEMMASGLRPRVLIPASYAIVSRLKGREPAAILQRSKYQKSEIEAVLALEGESKKLASLLAGKKANAPKDAYAILEKAPMDLLLYVLAESSNATARNKIRNYLQKWRPMRLDLGSAMNELENIGMPRGPKFDKVIEDYFGAQLAGRVKAPEDRTRILRKLSGIKEPPPKKVKEPKKKSAKAEDLLAKAVKSSGKEKPAPPAAPGSHAKPPASTHDKAAPAAKDQKSSAKKPTPQPKSKPKPAKKKKR
ncbi:MAG TPA: hypothetical protein VFO34_07115 [Candidatus Acidoferrales bacterium]|nr:hypothetical protein [Candidatus Acidoferrales bacterium]